MGMAVLMASPNPPVALRSKIETSQSQRTLAHYRASVSIGSHSRCHFLTHSVKIRAAEHFGEPKNVTDYLDDLVKSLWETSPRPLKEFPWKEAKYMILERLLFHGQKAFKWSIIVLLVVSSVSDVLLAISRNRELMIPIGLFIGVALTDFFREFLHEYFRSMKDESFKHLVGIGLFFVLIKLISLSFEVPGGYCFLILGMVA
uniref:Uncharacterized protein LOC105055887 isoform X1 n=1 Tax=Elaeis guineensis var. tenera TaxID=51953 RepID=A0A8N4FA83_ELAGV|nr:uncharacterized protein LOC105055887 isoform X1 [Elaeis guineensis]